METRIVKVSKHISLSLCLSAWLLAGNAHAASSHLYPAGGCQEIYPDPDAVLERANGDLTSNDGEWVTCPIVTDASSMRITVTVFYEAGLFAPPTYAAKPVIFNCAVRGYNPATNKTIADRKEMQVNLRNHQAIGGSLTLSIQASHQFNLLECYLPASKLPLSFRLFGYQVEES
jgi:hypothetical protein